VPIKNEISLLHLIIFFEHQIHLKLSAILSTKKGLFVK